MGVSVAGFVISAAGIGGWVWARDDFFPRQLTLVSPLQGTNRVAVVSDFDLQSDANHSIRLAAPGKWSGWKKWTDVVTQSELADQNWKLLWSRDGSLLALQKSPGLIGEPRLKTPIYTHAFDFNQNKTYESLDSWQQFPRSPFSRTIAAMMKRRGGAVAGRQTKREVGVWRWQDRAIKDAW